MSRDNNQFNFKKGAAAMIVLAILRTSDMYGYQLCQTMNRMSNGLFVLQEGTLYPILYRLLEQGFISDKRVQVGKRMTRVYYHIEPTGIEYYNSLINDYKSLNTGVEMILKECEENENE